MQLSGLKFAVIAHYDAYLNNAGAFAQAVTEVGGAADFLTLDSQGMTVSEAQRAAACRQWPGLSGCPQYQVEIEDLRSPSFLSSYDGIFLGAGGQDLLTGFRNLSEAFQHLGPQRPVVATGFPGILDAGRTAGMLFRCPSDIVLLPAPAQFAIYRFEMGILGKRTDNALLYGIPSLPAKPVRSAPVADVKRVLFIDQSAIPRSADERRDLVGELVSFLEGFPESEMLIRERVREGETSIHEKAAGTKLSTIIADLQPIFPVLERIRFKQDPLPDLFQEVDGALSISSTGLLEALAAGLPAASLSKFSTIPRYGNGFFRNSGIQVNIAEIICRGWPAANAKWVRRNVLSPLRVSEADQLTGQERLVQRLQLLLSSPRSTLPNPANHGFLARRVARLKPHVLLQRMLSPFR